MSKTKIRFYRTRKTEYKLCGSCADALRNPERWFRVTIGGLEGAPASAAPAREPGCLRRLHGQEARREPAPACAFRDALISFMASDAFWTGGRSK